MDLYILATPYRVTWTFFFFSREHTIDFNEWQGEDEYHYVSSNPPLKFQFFLSINVINIPT